MPQTVMRQQLDAMIQEAALIFESLLIPCLCLMLEKLCYCIVTIFLMIFKTEVLTLFSISRGYSTFCSSRVDMSFYWVVRDKVRSLALRGELSDSYP